MTTYDVVIVGAGAAGMMCAIEAGRRGRKVALLEHTDRPGNKILISGGGRCNFTNTQTSPERFVSENAHFAKSALASFTPTDFIRLVQEYNIAFHEKQLGQFFCRGSARQIVEMLVKECVNVQAQMFFNCRVKTIQNNGLFVLDTSLGTFHSLSLVIATGGLSFPRIGASDFGHRVARQFGLKVVDTSPALDGFVFADNERNTFEKLAGVSINCIVASSKARFHEDILFTHLGLSGPAALQTSLYWQEGNIVEVNFLPEMDASSWLLTYKHENRNIRLKNVLASRLPKRFAEVFCQMHLDVSSPVCSIPDKTLQSLGKHLNRWRFVPQRTVGYDKAEVTRGGVDTRELSSKTMETKNVPGLYFIGEVVDVTGWLGGYNFQWAWASGAAAGRSL